MLLRRELKVRDYDTSDTHSPGSYLAKRRALSIDIANLRIPQRLYMPGSGSLLNTIDNVLLAEKLGTVELWLPRPSHLPRPKPVAPTAYHTRIQLCALR